MFVPVHKQRPFKLIQVVAVRWVLHMRVVSRGRGRIAVKGGFAWWQMLNGFGCRVWGLGFTEP